ncbi:MAG: inorganic phosphate transporter, partial [Candidatus Omnitrophica bacterium]|nr:inorganic phosphate transporter [Candidatus Omnitrophota bacterium]
GANNSANATGVFYQAGTLSAYQAALIGGVSIALGAVTFSKNVMLTVGKRLLNLDAFSAFIVILSEAITVHIFAIIGVPVSTSQAVVGGVLGIGIVKGMRTVDIRTLRRILYAWILTPVIGGIFSYFMYRLFC